MKVCYHCQKPIPYTEKVGRQDACPYCLSDLHCCLNCTFYDEYAANRCREPAADWVSDREKKNFCEFFSFKENNEVSSKSSREEKARAELEALFKKKNS